jgi:hypothetical protein
LKRRGAAWFLIVLTLGLALYTGSRLQQAVAGERDLTSQIHDLSAAGSSASNAAVSGAVERGIESLSVALSEVRGSAHADEFALAVEIILLLAGIVLLRRPAVR